MSPAPPDWRDKTQPGERLAFALLALALFAVWLVTHPYRGIQGDALIYVTRAWAPRAIVDGDMLFAFERQTDFTLFNVLLHWLTQILSVAEAARWTALCGAALWFAALVALASAIARAAGLTRGAALAMCALVALAPLGYAASPSFSAGETLAVPRPFAEGFVLFALAAMLERRWVSSALALAAAVLFHPLMGLAGAALVFVWGALAERRLWLAAIAGVAILLLAAVAGAPLASRLFTTFEADWLSLLRRRTSYLFLTQAPAPFWVDALWRGAILAVAAQRSEGRLRGLFVAALAAGLGGVALSLLFSDLWPSVLITQLQPWRVLFLTAILAPMAVVVIAASGAGLPLALIACAYMTRDAGALSALFSVGALVSSLNGRVASPLGEKALWIVAAAAWLAFDATQLVAFRGVLAAAPPDLALPWSYVWTLHPLALPVAALVLYAAMKAPSPHVWLAGGAAVAAALCAVARFDDRTPVDRALESRSAPAFVAAMPAGDAPVLWLGQGKEAWYWLGRANWVAPVQASAIVFSRDLAALWEERMRFLISVGLVGSEALDNQLAPALREAAPEAVAALCGRADAPAAIIAPLTSGAAVPPGARRVDAPALSFQLQAGDAVRFEKSESLAVWSCPR